MGVMRLDGKHFLDEETYEKAKAMKDLHPYSFFCLNLVKGEILLLGNPLENSIDDIRKEIEQNLHARALLCEHPKDDKKI